MCGMDNGLSMMNVCVREHILQKPTTSRFRLSSAFFCGARIEGPC
jgi:hypothetical protein